MNINARLTALEDSIDASCPACRKFPADCRFGVVDTNAKREVALAALKCPECGKHLATFNPITLDGDRLPTSETL